MEQALSGSEASVEEAVEWVGKTYLKADGPMLVVVLDAFHHVSDEPEILRLVSALLEHSLENLRYIIACRSIPALPALATLGAQGP